MGKHALGNEAEQEKERKKRRKCYKGEH